MIDVDSRKTVRGINVLVILGERAMAAKIYGQLYIDVCQECLYVRGQCTLQSTTAKKKT